MIFFKLPPIFNRFGRDTHGNTVRRNISRHNGSSANNATTADRYPINYSHAGAKPHIIFNDNTLSRNALLTNRALEVIENMINGHKFYHWSSIYIITYSYATLPTNHIEFADKAISADADAGLG